MNILLISGSLREKSFNTALLRAFAAAIPENVSTTLADIRLPLFNADTEANLPEEVATLKEHIAAADAIIISTPEYNRSTSGVLKNAIDWASRPGGQNSLAHKRVLVTSASTGGIAGALALYDVKKSLLHLNAQVLSSPEFMVGHAADKFNEAGELTDEATKDYIKKAIDALVAVD